MKYRFFKTGLLATVILGGIWILFNRDQIRNPSDVVSLVKQQLSALQPGFDLQAIERANGDSRIPPQPTRQFVTHVVRIASFSLNRTTFMTLMLLWL